MYRLLELNMPKVESVNSESGGPNVVIFFLLCSLKDKRLTYRNISKGPPTLKCQRLCRLKLVMKKISLASQVQDGNLLRLFVSCCPNTVWVSTVLLQWPGQLRPTCILPGDKLDTFAFMKHYLWCGRFDLQSPPLKWVGDYEHLWLDEYCMKFVELSIVLLLTLSQCRAMHHFCCS